MTIQRSLKLENSETLVLGITEITLSIVKRFGNQKVKENSKTNVEKDSGGSK
jgi:hypothetical protein